MYRYPQKYRTASGRNYCTSSRGRYQLIHSGAASGKWYDDWYYYDTFWLSFHRPQLVKIGYSGSWWSNHDQGTWGIYQFACYGKWVQWDGSSICSNRYPSGWSGGNVFIPWYIGTWNHTRWYRGMSGRMSWNSGVRNGFRNPDGSRYKTTDTFRSDSYFRIVPWNGRMAEQCAGSDQER